MRSGALRHRVTFQARSTERDDYGGQSTTWDDVYCDIPASVQPLSGRELLAAQAVQNDMSVRVTVRYFGQPVDATMRISFNGRFLDIISVLNVNERNKELQILCSEGTAKG